MLPRIGKKILTWVWFGEFIWTSEFASATPGSTPDALNNNTLADVWFTTGQLLPQTTPLETCHSQVLEHANSIDLSSPPSTNKRRSSGNDKDANESAKKPNTEVRNKASKLAAQDRKPVVQTQKFMQSINKQISRATLQSQWFKQKLSTKLHPPADTVMPFNHLHPWTSRHFENGIRGYSNNRLHYK